MVAEKVQSQEEEMGIEEGIGRNGEMVWKNNTTAMP